MITLHQKHTVSGGRGLAAPVKVRVGAEGAVSGHLRFVAPPPRPHNAAAAAAIY